MSAMDTIILVFTLCILTLVNSQCPTPESITPCKCIFDNLLQKRLICEGNQINDLSTILNGKLKANSENGVMFATLLINDTSITTIEPETFGDAIFEKIHITNNPNLTNIDPKVFRKTIETNSCLDLYLINAQNYELNEQLFQLINSLKPKQEIFLEGLGITEIPDNAFILNPFIEFIVIMKNQIKRIGKSAFIQLPKLTTLVLTQNKISEIHSNGLTFDLSQKGSNLWALLDQNQLTEKSFQQNWSNSEPGVRKIEFGIDRNLIKSLPEDVFKSVLLSSSTEYLFFANNDIVCDCDMKYLSSIKSEVELKLKSALCSNLNSRNVLTLKDEEFGQCFK